MRMEFQAVIFAAGHGSRLSDLTLTTPKCLLPVGNKPMMWYPIQMLENSGFQDVIIITTESQKEDVWKCLSCKCNISIKIDIVTIPDDKDWGTADTLRHIKDKLHHDILVISCDLIMADIPLHRIADLHRTNNSTCTALFTSQLTFLKEVVVPGPKSKHKAVEKDLVGVDDMSSRLLYLTAEADIDEFISLKRSVLTRYPQIKLHTNLHDAHLYMFKHQILDILVQKPSISAIKGELLPYLVKMQFSKRGNICKGVSDTDYNALAYSTSSSSINDSLARISCHVYINEGGLAVRVNTLAHYVEINRQISRYMSSFGDDAFGPLIHPQTKLVQKSQIGSDSLVGSNCSVGDKSSVKHSVIGEHVNVGIKCKISNSLIMDHVNIKDNCDISGCIIASNVNIDNDVKLKDCLVSNNQHIKQDVKLSNEAIVDEDRMMEI